MGPHSNLSGQLRIMLYVRLRRTPLFTAAALLTLAVAVGANTVVFSIVNGVLLKSLSYPDPDQLIAVDHLSHQAGFKKIGISPSLYFVYRDQNTTLVDIGAYNNDELDVTGAGTPEHVRVLDVTDGTLSLLGISPALGRLFTRNDDSPGAAQTVVLTYPYWRQRLGGASSAIGQLDYGGRRSPGKSWSSSPGFSFSRSERSIVDTSHAMGSCHHDPRKFLMQTLSRG